MYRSFWFKELPPPPNGNKKSKLCNFVQFKNKITSMAFYFSTHVFYQVFNISYYEHWRSECTLIFWTHWMVPNASVDIVKCSKLSHWCSKAFKNTTVQWYWTPRTRPKCSKQILNTCLVLKRCYIKNTSDVFREIYSVGPSQILDGRSTVNHL